MRGEITVKVAHSMASTILASIILMFAACSGERVLYVQPNSTTTCPSQPCLTITEYGERIDQYITNETSTSFVFLPGDHLLNTKFEVANTQQAITLRAEDPRRIPVINCAKFRVQIRFIAVRRLHLSSLKMVSCGRTNSIIGLRAVSSFVIENFHVHDSDQSFSVMFLENCTGSFANISFVGNTGFANVVLSESIIEFSGTNLFSHNHGDSSSAGGIAVLQSKVKLTGTNTFTSNSAGLLAGAIYCVEGELLVDGNVSFTHNFAHYGGAGFLVDSRLVLTGSMHFSGNVAHSGGGLLLANSFVDFQNDSQATFVNNSAVFGGGIFGISGTALRFEEDWLGTVLFMGNSAEQHGGAVYVQDSSPLTYCVDSSLQHLKQACFLQASTTTHKGVNFINNTALESGDAIYGGAVDTCADQQADFDEFVSVSNQPSKISSTPFKVCSCKDGVPDCNQHRLSALVNPGGTVQVSVAALGQRDGMNSALIVAETTGVQIKDQQHLQRVPNECFNVSYTIFAEPNTSGYVELYTDGPACFTDDTQLIVNVEVAPCPKGFQILRKPDNEIVCECDNLLKEQAFESECNATDGTLLRDKDYWIGYDEGSEGLVFSRHCPFDYCVTEVIHFQVNDSDAQCRFNRVGVLCGQCREGYSLLLGSSECKECSNEYLSLFVGFTVAGISLLGFLLFSKCTVGIGAINGLIFYANVVKDNENVLIPNNSGDYLSFLRTFLAWLNLDFGIPTCFYDGMDAYARTWLQYAFPLYLWFLMGLVFLACRYSTWCSQIMGSNPVAAMATLLLLSYTKILRTIIAVFSSVTLQYEHRDSEQVWLYDGSVPFIDTSDVRHLFLFLFSLLVFVLLFVPYTILLFSYQWLLAGSNWKYLSWLNHPRVKSFLDAYHAPYKAKHRYLTGLLLLARLALSVISAVRVFSEPNANTLAILVLLSLLYVWAWFSGGFYRKWYLDLLEASFYFNLSVFAFTTLYIDTVEELHDSPPQAAVATASLTIVFVVFVGIVACSICEKGVQRFITYVKTIFKKDDTDSPNTQDVPVDQSSPVRSEGIWYMSSFWEDIERQS